MGKGCAMARLNNEMGISEVLLKKLAHHKIFSILDFLQEDIEKLSTTCDVSFKV